MKIEELRSKHAALLDEQKNLVEGDFSADDQVKFDSITTDVEKIENQIRAIEKVAERELAQKKIEKGLESGLTNGDLQADGLKAFAKFLTGGDKVMNMADWDAIRNPQVTTSAAPDGITVPTTTMSYVTEAIDRLASQFQASPKLVALLTAIVGPLDDAKATADSLKTERWIDSAVGTQLDGCGYIVGEKRAGRDDDAYRAAIKYRVFVNISNGTPNDLIKGLKYLIDSEDYQYLEMYPATAILFADGPDVPIDIHDQMQDLAPAGISDVPVLVSYTEKPFRFAKQLPDGNFSTDTGDYLTANGAIIKVSQTANQDTGPTLGGIAAAKLSTGTQYISVGGALLAIHSPETGVIVDSGYHTTGLFT